MLDFLRRLFLTDDFMPHGHCYFWRPEIVWLHVTSDAIVALSYTTIPFTLGYFVRKRRDLPFTWMFLCFAAFIIACGATHYMEIWTLWNPAYRLSGVIKAFTALVSLPTAFLLVRLVPKALAIPSPAELRRLNAELATTEAALRRSNAGLAAANSELEAFSYSVAHDLRAPLRHMDGFAHILLADYSQEIDEQGQDCLQEIRASATRMAVLIDSLLELSRVTRSDLSIRSVNLSELARASLMRLQASAPQRDVELVIEEGLRVDADPELAAVLIENLLNNAWKFSSKAAKPRIEFGARSEHGERVFYVRDNGAGFEEGAAKRMFAAFQRFHGLTEFPGTGIGLATVKRIVLRLGGRVWASGKVGAGATFYFTLGADGEFSGPNLLGRGQPERREAHADSVPA
ncbi:MAG: ATP-binding protein [Myxococcales bacterium]